MESYNENSTSSTKNNKARSNKSNGHDYLLESESDVDMLYFPIYEGESFTFFNAIFNGADSFISIGVALLFIYNSYVFPKENKEG